MAQANFTPIQLYRSTTASAVPTSGNLADGELAINTNDGKLYYKDSGGTVQLIASKAGASGDVVGPASATDNAVVRFDGTTGKLVQNSVVTIADTTGDVAGVGALTASGNLTLSGGTANGVLYLNGSKVATSGSALVFNGTDLSIKSGGSLTSYRPDNATYTLQYMGAGGTGGYVWDNQNGDGFRWLFASSEKMRLASATGGVGALGIGYTNLTSVGDSGLAVLGNVGIGTSSPTCKLNVTVSAASTAVSAFFNTDTANGNGVYIKAGGANAGKYALAIDNAASSSLLYLDSSGNLGLGVTPSAWDTFKALQVGNSSLHSLTTGNNSGVTSNAYYQTGWKYVDSASATYYQQFNGKHIWFTAPSGTAGNAITFTQAMTLDASGNLGIGTTSPVTLKSAKTLQVYGNIKIGNDNGAGLLSLGDTASTGANVGIWRGAAGAYGSTGNYLNLGGYDGITFTTGNADIASQTERARIDSSGNLLVGTTSAVAIAGRNSKVNVVQSADGAWAGGFIHSTSTGAQAFGVAIYYSASAPNSALNPFLYCEDNTVALRAEIRSNGGLANYSANNANLSDRREKTNFAPAGKYLSKICAIPVQTFNYIDQNMEDDPGLTLGVVAQDVQAVAPELVMESNWGTKDNPKMRLSIYQTDLQYALMKCIQEQQSLIESLTTRVAQLEGA